jgi:hypothetical protein
MKRTAIYGSIVVIMAAGLVVLGGWARSAPASASGRHVYLAANGANPRSAAVAPRDAPISVDSSLFLTDMTWAWASTRATGTGTATVNLCDPDCAAGNDVKVPVAITLSDPQSVCGREFFTTMQLTITGRVPAGLVRSTSMPVAPFC